MPRKRKPRKPTASAFLTRECFDIEIVAVNRAVGTVLLQDWDTELVMVMLDADGEETTNGAHAVSGVVDLGDDVFVSLDLADWERPTFH